MSSANERMHYYIMLSLIGQAHTKNDPVMSFYFARKVARQCHIASTYCPYFEVVVMSQNEFPCEFHCEHHTISLNEILNNQAHSPLTGLITQQTLSINPWWHLSHWKPGVCFKNTRELVNLLLVNKLHIFQCVWNLKGNPWNSTQNILPIHWKRRFLFSIENFRALRFMSS